jgi:hypothetical protein
MLIGCGSGVKVVPVNGTVRFGGKSPPYACIVNFLPTGVVLTGGQGNGVVPQVAFGIGECDAFGAFSAKCLRDRRGLVPGRYEVRVSCYLPTEVPNAVPVSVVPADFTPPELVVPADARSVRYDLEVPAAVKK